MRFSQRAQRLKPSPTLALANTARELAAKGKDVVSLTVGEPDWPTFSAIKKSAVKAIESDFTKYTAANGIVELRQAIALNLKKELGLDYKPNEVVVGAGAKYVIYSLLQMLVETGDEVLIPSPYWVSYPTMVELAGGTPVIVNCSRQDHFKMKASRLKEFVNERTKALILCSPSNPTGLSYTREELQELAVEIKKFPDLIVFSDDIYNRLNFNDDLVAPHLLHVAPELKNQVIPINGASKSMSMTGWRVGWAAGPETLMKLMADFLSQSTSNLCSIAQKAALTGLLECEPEMQEARKKLLVKRDFGLSLFEQLKFVKPLPPNGAFYFWVDVEAVLGKSFRNEKVRSSSQLATILLNEFYLATVPGEEFGCPGFLRMSYATSDLNLEKAVTRLKDFEKELG
jgi:aspartate aminotransferase